MALIGENLGPIITSITFGPDGPHDETSTGVGFNVDAAVDCEAPAAPYTSLVCTVPKGVFKIEKSWNPKCSKLCHCTRL